MMIFYDDPDHWRGGREKEPRRVSPVFIAVVAAVTITAILLATLWSVR